MKLQGTAVGDEMLNTIEDTRGHTAKQKYLINWLTKSEEDLNSSIRNPAYKMQVNDVNTVNDKDSAKFSVTQHQIQRFLKQFKYALGSENAKIT